MRFGSKGRQGRNVDAPHGAEGPLHPPTPVRTASADHLSQEIIARLVSQGKRGLTVAGVSSGVGVSTTAMSLARSLARVQVSTLLIDADLLGASKAWIYGQAKPPGLSEVLRGGLDLDDAFDESRGSGLTVLHAGDPEADGEARIFSHALGELLERCMRRFQITIVDTAAANRSTSAFHIARATGYSLIVARRHDSFSQDLSLFSDQMREMGAEVVGSVLTG